MEYSTDPECSNHLVPFNIVPVMNYQGAGCTLRGHIYPDYRKLMYLFWLYLPPSWITLALQQTTHSDRLSTTARLLYLYLLYYTYDIIYYHTLLACQNGRSLVARKLWCSKELYIPAINVEESKHECSLIIFPRHFVCSFI